MAARDNFHEHVFLEIMDLEEQKFREELDSLEKKHRLESLKKERERARVPEEKELSVVGGATNCSTGCSLSPSVEPGTNE